MYLLSEVCREKRTCLFLGGKMERRDILILALLSHFRLIRASRDAGNVDPRKIVKSI